MSRGKRTLVVAHDAGGAEVLSSYVRRNGVDGLFVLAGPALTVFQHKLGAVQLATLADALPQCDRLLCGTSWQSTLELEAIAAARAHGLPSAALLDHWVNYRARFERGAQLTLPDEIWVGDSMAMAMARDALPETTLRQIDNPYVADLRDELRALPSQSHTGQALRVLYVCEPVAEHALLRFGDERYWGYTEQEALRYFLDHLSLLGKPVEAIVVRPHPSERAGKYDTVLAGCDLPVAMSKGAPLLDEIVAADVVVGANSMAMVVGLIAGRRVFSCIPPGGRPCALPHTEIEHLAALAAARK
jgi:hypothetical protein